MRNSLKIYNNRVIIFFDAVIQIIIKVTDSDQIILSLELFYDLPVFIILFLFKDFSVNFIHIHILTFKVFDEFESIVKSLYLPSIKS